MNKGKTSLKETAQRAFSRGDWRKALECFQQHCIQEPRDLRSRLKIAELLERLGQKKEAVQVYRNLAEAYAQDGFLLQAISLHKMILRIDPLVKDVNERLAQLYAERANETIPSRSFPRIPLFSELNEQELQSLLPHLQSKTFSKGSHICRVGEEGDSLFVIIRGEVAIIKQSLRGEEVWIRNLRDGDFFGEFGFFVDQKRHAMVKAITECEVLEILREPLNELLKIHPRVNGLLQELFRERILDNFLALSPLFSSLTSEERREVLKRFQLRENPEGTFLFKGGDPPTSLYMVRSGEVEIFTQNRQGKKVRLGLLKSGNVFGEIGLLFDKPRMAYARTTCPTELLEMTHEDLKACLLQYPHLQTKLKEFSLKRLSRIKELLSQEDIQKAKEAMV